MKKIKSLRKKRYLRGKKKVLGTSETPRLCVYRSLTNFRAQLVDDVSGKTILSLSTLDKELKGKLKSSGNVEASKMLGEIFAQKAKKANFSKIKFDKSGYLYHGRVKGFAQSCRKNGLEF